MRRSRFAKGLLMMLLFAVVTAERSTVHPCPLHGDPVATSSPTAPVQSPAPVHDHRTHQAATDAHGSASAEHASHTQHSCNCLGDCNAGSVVRVPPNPAHEISVDDVVILVARIPDTSLGAAVSPAFDLPFANGPPAPARIA